MLLVIGALTLAVGASAQFRTESAHTQLYFPQFVDGGPRAAQWMTTFTFVNVSPSAAEVNLSLYNDSGGPLSLDFGAGSSSTHTFTVPTGGIRILRSRIASQTVVSGWAIATCSLPVQATVAFRVIANGIPLQEITAQPTLPTFVYTSAANRFLGVALANAYANVSITVDLDVTDSEGQRIGGPVSVALGPHGHVVFNLWEKFPHLRDRGFDGVLRISAASDLGDFLAWTLNADASGTLSALPPGELGWPVSHWERNRLTYKRVLNAARRLDPAFSAPVQFQILYDREVNAYASGGEEVAVTMGLSELISDSPSELAWALAHEFGHIYQQRNGGMLKYHPNREFDADIWGFFISLIAGYDPYAAAGTLAKLAMATGEAGLTTQFEQQNAADAHKSFNERLATVFQAMKFVCAQTAMASVCAEYKSAIHPHLPPSAPLMREPRRALE